MKAHAILPDNFRALTDGELIVSAVEGRPEPFEELVRRYQRPITGYVFRIVGNYEASLDVTQEVFIKVYRSLSKYSSDYKFSTWLYRIAHNAKHRVGERRGRFRASARVPLCNARPGARTKRMEARDRAGRGALACGL